MTRLVVFILGISVLESVFAAGSCRDQFSIDHYYKPPVSTRYVMPGMKVASVTDARRSTGATLFFFPEGAHANFDARGGSVASVETTLLEEGGYSNRIDGIVFTGGSTMGLAAADGVRQAVFEQRAAEAGDGAGAFDLIPSVPGAVVYDFGSRLAPFNDQLLYPNNDMGQQLVQNLRNGEFFTGRAGAGVNTTCNKICEQPRWGGQGLAHGRMRIHGQNYNIVTAVVLNAVGDVYDGNESLSERYPDVGVQVPKGHKQNTTLSIVVTDYPFDRSQLKRIAVMAHTGMAAQIRPFHGSTDGDIMFTVSTAPSSTAPEGVEEVVAMEASKLMGTAIHNAVKASNLPFEGNR